MVEVDFQEIQREIEKELFRNRAGNLDRFYSLINLMFAASGFIITVLTFVISRGIVSLEQIIDNDSIKLCFLSLFMAFIISIMNVLSLIQHKKLVQKDGLIGYREGNELVNNNLKMYIVFDKQKYYYLISLIFIVVSLLSLINSFSQNNFLNILVVIGFLGLVVFSIYRFRKWQP
jgi:hypothetical protein